MTRPRLGLIVLCAAASGLLLFPTLFMRPIPAFIHDWNWPPDSASLMALLSRGWSAWDPSGLGQPNAYISALPNPALLWLLAKVLPAVAVLWILLFVVWTVGMLGAAWLARRALSVPTPWALVAGIFYMAAPVALTKFVAGHFSFLEAYAVLPWFIRAVLRANSDSTISSALLAAFFLALSGIQIQFVGFELYILLLLVILRCVRFKTALVIACLAAPGILPGIIGPTILQHGAKGTLAIQHAVLGWELQQSAPPLAALEGRGYFAQYFEQLTPPLLWHWLLLFPAFATAAIFLRRARKFSVFLIILALTGWLFAMGLRGPLSPLLKYAFVHVAAASLYRELYDAMPMLWLAYALLASALLASIPRRYGALAAALLFVALLPGWVALPAMFAKAPPLREVLRAQSLAPTGASGYVVWWPGNQPIGPVGSKGGTDPLEFTPAKTLTPLFEYQPTGDFAAALDRGEKGEWDSAVTILRSLGVAMIVNRRDLGSFRGSFSGPRFRSVSDNTELRRTGSAGAYDVYWIKHPLGYASLEIPHSVAETAGHVLPRTFVDYKPNRRSLVAAFPFYDRSPSVAQCGSDSVLGFPDAYLRTPYRWFLAAPVNVEGQCRWMSRSDLARLPSRTLVVASRWSPRKLANPSAATMALQVGTVDIKRRTPDFVEGTYDAPTAALLILRTSFDPRWRLTVDKAFVASEKSDGYANGWRVARGRHRFVAVFEPAARIHILLIVCGLWIIGLVITAEVIRVRTQ